MDPTAAATPDKPITLIPVKESRAQRLQRQQARFRDRGGIFVPSNRNTLIDILLGRKAQSPLKRRSRSLSCSPTKNQVKEFPVGGQQTAATALSSRRTSPRKKPSTKQVDEREISEPIAGPSKLASSDKQIKPAKKARKVKAKTDEPPTAPKRRGRLPKAKLDEEALPSRPHSNVINEELEPNPKPKGRKRATTTTTKSSGKKGRPRKKIEQEISAMEDEDGADEAAVDRLLTSTSPAKLKAKEKKVPLLRPIPDADIKPAEHLARRVRPRREKGTYLELSDDEVIPTAKILPSNKVEIDPPLVRKPPDKKEKERQQLASIEKEDNVQSSEAEELEIRLSSKKRAQTGIDDTTDTIDKDADSRPRKRTRAEPQSGTESSDLSAKKCRTKKLLADNKTRKEAAFREHNATDGDASGSVKVVRAQTKPKRTKNTEPGTKKSRSKNPKTEIDQQVPNMPSEIVEPHVSDKISQAKKRPLETVLGDSKKPPTKRKKVSAREEPQGIVTTQQHNPIVSLSEEGGKGTTVVRTSRKLKENAGQTKFPKSAPKQAKLSAKSALIVVPRRPPKSVLERIKEPRPQIEDDDPDPIDFLS